MSRLPSLLPTTPRIPGVIKILGSLAIVAAILMPATRRADRDEGRVVIHVTTPDVEVEVGGKVFRVGQIWDLTRVVRLPLGEHTLTTRRDGRVVRSEPFTLTRGQDLVLTAWAPKDGPAIAQARPAAEPADSGRLEVR